MTHRFSILFACLTALTLGACASTGATGSELVAERFGDATLVRLDAEATAAWQERALTIHGTASIEDLLNAQGCLPMGPPDVGSAAPAGSPLIVVVEHAFDCGESAPASVVTIFETDTLVAADAAWLSSERLEQDAFTGAIDRLAVVSDGIVAERAPGFGEPTRELSRVVGHGEATAPTCDQALIAASFLAMQSAIEKCGPGSYSRSIDGEFFQSVQHISDYCRATVDQTYACHEVTSPSAP